MNQPKGPSPTRWAEVTSFLVFAWKKRADLKRDPTLLWTGLRGVKRRFGEIALRQLRAKKLRQLHAQPGFTLQREARMRRRVLSLLTGMMGLQTDSLALPSGAFLTQIDALIEAKRQKLRQEGAHEAPYGLELIKNVKIFFASDPREVPLGQFENYQKFRLVRRLLPHAIRRAENHMQDTLDVIEALEGEAQTLRARGKTRAALRKEKSVQDLYDWGRINPRNIMGRWNRQTAARKILKGRSIEEVSQEEDWKYINYDKYLFRLSCAVMDVTGLYY